MSDEFGRPPAPISLPMVPVTSIEEPIRVFTQVDEGEIVAAIVDTGSEGLVFARSYLKGKNIVETHIFFEIRYSSSNVVLTGTWVWAPVTFYAPNHEGKGPGAAVAKTVSMLVRAVDAAPNSKEHSIHSSMVGVGFDRSPASAPVSLANPFLQIEAMINGTGPKLDPGFIIDWQKQTITLGLDSTLKQGFNFINLKPKQPATMGWTAPLVTVELPDANITLENASLLIDSGLTDSFIQAPKNDNPPLVHATSHVADGQVVQISVPASATEPALPLYSFTTGVANTNPPDVVFWEHSEINNQILPNFVNTGRHVLQKLQYLYDAGQGQLGFKIIG
jgi:hypothetical protein